MQLTHLKALALKAQRSNRLSNQPLTESESLSNFPSNFQSNNGPKLDEKLDEYGLQEMTAPPSYLGLSVKTIIPAQRLRFYWSILGDCIEDRKVFAFKCTGTQEAHELKILTLSLVYQMNDRWKVVLDGLELRAEPPLE
ncbi:MAG: hypothetical protein HN472_04760 [Nitrospina sp.]|nr:hypothetical protein [Nitrospina sp.]MBT4048675.1 hypothetical protein [Nitrospina sp.]